ncbi:MAG: peptide chain release factor N(5)-glutamine methyltransferase [Phycisphaeraceae bacterium]
MPEAPAEIWTTRKLLAWTTQRFERDAIDSPRLAAEMLLSHVLGVERLRLYTDPERPASHDERARFRELVERATQHEPVDYLVGQAPFYGMSLSVDARVLIPRPSTETLVDEAVAFARERGGSLSMADIGTGTGAIALAIAKALPEAKITATDLHEGPLEVARANAARLGLTERITFKQGDLLDPPQGERFDVLMSNPPYIPAGDLPGLDANVRDHEPHAALDGGEDGLDLIRRLLSGAPGHLASSGLLLMEYNGGPQTEVLRSLVQQAGCWSDMSVLKDHEGLDRVIRCVLSE